MVVIPVAMRGREDGAELEFGNDGDPAFALRASSGGSSKPMVAYAPNVLFGASCGKCGNDFYFDAESARALWLTRHDTEHFDFVSFFRERDHERDSQNRCDTCADALATGLSSWYCPDPNVCGPEPVRTYWSMDKAGTLQSVHRGVPSAEEVAGGQVVCVTGERTHALTSEGADASEDGTGRGTPVVYQCHGSNVGPMGTLRQGNGGVTGGVPFMADAGVRRLSPMECERLQGYDDQWTEWGLKEDGDKTAQSDAQRYRQLGNSVAVPVVSWIAERLTEVDGRM